MAPSVVDSARGAARLAETHLAPLGDRWLHTQAVAERARELAAAVPSAQRELLVAAAWLHDIGYAPALRDTGFHPLDGARYLAALGAPAQLAAYDRPDPVLLDALTCADMTTGPAGQRFAFTDRVDEILIRYAAGSEVHTAITAATPALAAAVARTHVRLSGQPM